MNAEGERSQPVAFYEIGEPSSGKRTNVMRDEIDAPTSYFTHYQPVLLFIIVGLTELTLGVGLILSIFINKQVTYVIISDFLLLFSFIVLVVTWVVLSLIGFIERSHRCILLAAVINPMKWILLIFISVSLLKAVISGQNKYGKPLWLITLMLFVGCVLQPFSEFILITILKVIAAEKQVNVRLGQASPAIRIDEIGGIKINKIRN